MEKYLFKLISILSLIFVGFQLNAQEFSFKIYFYDAIGNSDSIVLGYDQAGTDNIDVSFGEINIINDPVSTTFDVRITNEWYNRYYFGIPGTYHTKTQIIEKKCDSWFTTLGIDIYCENWPVIATWDNNLFDSPCINGSVFTSQIPNTWWDVESPSNLLRQPLIENGFVTFSSNFSGDLNDDFSHLNDFGDTIIHFWQNFADSTLLSLGVDSFTEFNNLFVYPNPTNDVINIDYQNKDNSNLRITLTGLDGKEYDLILCKNQISLENFKPGIYFLNIQNQSGKTLRKKINKF